MLKKNTLNFGRKAQTLKIIILQVSEIMRLGGSSLTVFILPNFRPKAVDPLEKKDFDATYLERRAKFNAESLNFGRETLRKKSGIMRSDEPLPDDVATRAPQDENAMRRRRENARRIYYY